MHPCPLPAELLLGTLVVAYWLKFIFYLTCLFHDLCSLHVCFLLNFIADTIPHYASIQYSSSWGNSCFAWGSWWSSSINCSSMLTNSEFPLDTKFFLTYFCLETWTNDVLDWSSHFPLSNSSWYVINSCGRFLSYHPKKLWILFY